MVEQVSPPANVLLSRSIHILFVDDSLPDVEIACWRLVHAGILFTWDVAHCQPTMMSSLARRPPHMIVSDNAMPGFDGFGAFRIAQQLAPGVPFVFHCGSPNQDLCRRMSALGAFGFADKDRGDELVELAHAVVRRVAPAP